MATPTPSVGRIVHYVSHGTPVREDGTQAFVPQCRAAIVTEVNAEEPMQVGLAVQNPTGTFFHPLAQGGCFQHEGGETPGSPDCPNRAAHGSPFRYCACGWAEASHRGGTWHWPERV